MNLPLNTDLTGKVAVVTGAAGTLCSVFSKALAASGAKVALLGRTYANVQKLADEITAEGGTAKAYECNVLDKTAVMACHEHVLADFGSCDILINGAGGNHPSATTDKEYYEPGDLDADTKSFFDLDETGVASVFNLNFMGILIPTQAFARDITVRSCRSTSGPVISAGLNRTIRYFIVSSCFLFRRFSVSVDDCFLERCARSGRDGVENIRVQCLAILVECFLRHEDVQPLLGFCQPDAVYLEHPVKGDRCVGFDLRACVRDVVDGNFHVRKIHMVDSSYSCIVISFFWVCAYASSSG